MSVKPACVKPMSVKAACVKPVYVRPACVKPVSVKAACVKPVSVKAACVKPVSVKAACGPTTVCINGLCFTYPLFFHMIFQLARNMTDTNCRMDINQWTENECSKFKLHKDSRANLVC